MRVIVAFLVALVSGPAFAQEVQNFDPAPGTWNYFGVQGARTAHHLELSPSLWLNYGNQPLVERDDDDEVAHTFVEHMTTMNLMAVLGLWDVLEIALDLPVSHVLGDELANLDNEGFALGDIRLIPKLRLFSAFDEDDDEGFGFALSLPLSLPTGDPGRYVGADQVELNPKLIGEARFAIFSLAANLGFRLRPSQTQVETTQLGNEVTYAAAAGVELGTPQMIVLGEVFGAAAVEDIESDSRSNPLEALAGLRIFDDIGLVYTAGLGFGLIPDYGTPLLRVLGMIAWRPPPPDKDTDKDGIFDPQDSCETVPEDKDGFHDTDGCPDPDNDGDGILDVDDKCPNEPETRNDYQDEDGCPDIIGDRDGDGLRDDMDKCPDAPEDKDGFEDEDGCPDPDNDQDGIPDTRDECPLQPEVINGEKDEDGCPDAAPAKVIITKDKIEILEKVFFESARAVIKPVSYDILNQVATVLIRNPHIEVIEVGGHTDSRGRDSYNLELSQNRAMAVRAYLLERGVPAGRLEARGYGETQPIEDNSTRDGRAVNRRVEFRILR